jgi:hypothetical protein
MPYFCQETQIKMILPNADRAIVPIEKLEKYCLNSSHDGGKHKSHLFSSLLGLEAVDADRLQRIIFHAAQKYDAVYTKTSEHGKHYHVEFPMQGKRGEYVLRSLWIVKNSENFPRMVSCYIKREKRKA